MGERRQQDFFAMLRTEGRLKAYEIVKSWVEQPRRSREDVLDHVDRQITRAKEELVMLKGRLTQQKQVQSIAPGVGDVEEDR